MKVEKQLAKQKQRRKWRVSNKARKAARGRMRLSVYRSNMHIYAQVIDDEAGQTIAAASSIQDGVCSGDARGTNIAGAHAVGTLVAQRAAEKGVKAVVFDRGRYKYHGRVAALAEGAREAGLEF